MVGVLPADYYQTPDVVHLAKDLLGKALCVRKADGTVVRHMITETEAYRGPEDRASHAYNGRRTARNEVMYQGGGSAYVYLVYGLHHMLNVVTGPTGTPHAVLIRGVEGIVGPGRVTAHYGITLKDNGASLQGPRIWIEECVTIAPTDIVTSARIGIDYAGPDAALPWRFYVKKRGDR
jgi:DNA-3-methyladenine glycosylase